VVVVVGASVVVVVGASVVVVVGASVVVVVGGWVVVVVVVVVGGRVVLVVVAGVDVLVVPGMVVVVVPAVEVVPGEVVVVVGRRGPLVVVTLARDVVVSSPGLVLVVPAGAVVVETWLVLVVGASSSDVTRSSTAVRSIVVRSGSGNNAPPTLAAVVTRKATDNASTGPDRPTMAMARSGSNRGKRPAAARSARGEICMKARTTTGSKSVAEAAAIKRRALSWLTAPGPVVRTSRLAATATTRAAKGISSAAF
jgi:hypothetical protein